MTSLRSTPPQAPPPSAAPPDGIGGPRAADLSDYEGAASSCSGRVAPLLSALAALDTEAVPLPGSGRTRERFSALSRVASLDVTAARVLEPHLDALAILAEAGLPAPRPGTTWGVFAAEAPGAVLEAAPSNEGWTLTGTKPWCSLGARLTHALVTARAGDDRRMFAVDLRAPGVEAASGTWVARGFAEVESGPLRFAGTAAEPVGGPGWYLARPGFRWGAVGVAAAWWGGCLPLFRALAGRSTDDAPLVASRVGELFRILESARLQLEAAAQGIDAAPASPAEEAVRAHAVRGAAADGVVATLAAVRDLLGPAALAFDEDLARRCADLELYVAQYHRGRDDVSLARGLADARSDARAVAAGSAAPDRENSPSDGIAERTWW